MWVLFTLKSTINDFKIIRNHFPYLALTAVIGIIVFNTLIYFAVKITSAVNLSLIAISIPLFMVVLSRIIVKEKVSNKKSTGIAIIIMGSLVLISKGPFQALLQIDFAIGDVFMLLACLFFLRIITIVVRKKLDKLSPKVFLFSVFVIGTILLFLFYFIENLYFKKVPFGIKTILVVSYVGICASLISFYFWNEAIRFIGTSKTDMIYYLIPVFSGVLAYIFLNQAIVLTQVISMGIIIVGLLITNKK